MYRISKTAKVESFCSSYGFLLSAARSWAFPIFSVRAKVNIDPKRSRHETSNCLVGLALAVLLSLIVAINIDAKDINLGWSGQGSWSTLPYIVAGERGLFEKEGLKVRLITFRGTNLMLTALLAGELDYATILPFLTGASARGLPVKILGGGYKEQLLCHYLAAGD